MNSLTAQQVRQLLQRLDDKHEDLLVLAEKASKDGAHSIASSRAMKAHGVLLAMREVMDFAGITPESWMQIHRRERAK